jgi:ribokinase
MKFITAGGLRVDYLITQAGEARLGMVGGNSVYAAVGARLWTDDVHIWARRGGNYPAEWLARLAQYGLGTAGTVAVAGRHDHRTFYAYTGDGRRVDSQPELQFARIGQPLPAGLAGYVHSTPGQDEPDAYEPLALRPDDWPPAYGEATAVHLSPLSLCTHRHLPPFLKGQGVAQVTADPGERYMIPRLAPYIRELLPHLDAFLPSAQEVRSLFGPDVALESGAATLAGWGVPIVVVKNGPAGVLLFDRERGRPGRFPAYHRPGDPRIVDPTGAGDAFCGGFMVGLARSGDAAIAARMGLVSASLVIEGYGALYALERGRAEAAGRLAELAAP